jgi:hypothetical protein
LPSSYENDGIKNARNVKPPCPIPEKMGHHLVHVAETDCSRNSEIVHCKTQQADPLCLQQSDYTSSQLETLEVGRRVYIVPEADMDEEEIKTED